MKYGTPNFLLHLHTHAHTYEHVHTNVWECMHFIEGKAILDL